MIGQETNTVTLFFFCNLTVLQEVWASYINIYLILHDPLEKEMATTPVFLPGESYGERSLSGYSP